MTTLRLNLPERLVKQLRFVFKAQLSGSEENATRAAEIYRGMKRFLEEEQKRERRVKEINERLEAERRHQFVKRDFLGWERVETEREEAWSELGYLAWSEDEALQEFLGWDPDRLPIGRVKTWLGSSRPRTRIEYPGDYSRLWDKRNLGQKPRKRWSRPR